MYHFNDEDCGCWIDGAFGQEHACHKLAGMVYELDAHELSQSLIAASEDRDLDIIDDLISDATDLLQENTDPELSWVWEAGDLLLCHEADLNG
jgi:hypothetical protein